MIHSSPSRETTDREGPSCKPPSAARSSTLPVLKEALTRRRRSRPVLALAARKAWRETLCLQRIPLLRNSPARRLDGCQPRSPFERSPSPSPPPHAHRPRSQTKRWRHEILRATRSRSVQARGRPLAPNRRAVGGCTGSRRRLSIQKEPGAPSVASRKNGPCMQALRRQRPLQALGKRTV
jgi:hypothetical protein